MGLLLKLQKQINGRLQKLKEEDGRILTEYQYTAAGRLKEIRTADGIRASYGYDSDGNLSRLKIGNDDKGSLLYDAFMVYDLNGNRTGKKGERLGADGKRQEMDTAYSYDLLNRMTEERRGQEGERYAYDPAGNRLRKQSCHYALTAAENRGSHPAGGAAGISYINGPVINPADDCVIDGEETYCYNERNQLTERRNRSVITKYLYDEDGSLVSEKEGSRTASYKYDLLNRQTHVRLPDGREQENSYDGEGLRAGVRENGKAATFLFLNGEILAECDGDSMPIRRHLPGLGLSHVQTLDDGVYHTYHQDEQGSTAYITGNEGTVENSYIYDAFGKVLESRENIKNRILYTGQQYDQETGQYYLRARYYNPVTGRFTQEDTCRGDGLNLYAYCGNNPVMYYDPSGYSKNCKKSDQAEPDKQINAEPETPCNPNTDVDSTVPKSNVPDESKSGASSRYDRTGYQSTGRSNNLFGRDRSTRRTTNLTEWRRSISKQNIHDEMSLFLGDDYVKVDAGKWRSLDGTRQFRVKPDDYLGSHGIGQPTVPNTPHVHFEFLVPRSNGNGFDVIKNIHVPISD